MGKTIKIFRNIEDLALFFAQKIADGVQEIPPNYHFTISLSGGSTPRKLFEYLALHFKTKINWQKVLIFWGDERCVDPESIESNFRMTKESLLDKVFIPADNIFRIHGEADPSDEAKRYSEKIRQNVHPKDNIPQFDLMMLGLGDDGHTVSIFPGNLHLFKSKEICEVAENPYSKQKRITITGHVINQTKMIIFLVTGVAKAEMVARIIEKKDGYDNLPASLVHTETGDVIWLLDEMAASKLSLKNTKK